MAAVTNTFTDTITITYTGNGKAISSPTGTYTGSKDAGVATVIPAGTVNMAIPIVFPHTTIQSFGMTTDQDLTVNVNSSTTPVPALTVKKTQGLFWATDFGVANPFTADVTTFYVSNAGVTDAKFNFRALYN